MKERVTKWVEGSAGRVASGGRRVKVSSAGREVFGQQFAGGRGDGCRMTVAARCKSGCSLCILPIRIWLDDGRVGRSRKQDQEISRDELGNQNARSAQSLQLASAGSGGRRSGGAGQEGQRSEAGDQGAGRHQSGRCAGADFWVAWAERGGEIDDGWNIDDAGAAHWGHGLDWRLSTFGATRPQPSGRLEWWRSGRIWISH